MTHLDPSSFLRRVLVADAATSTAAGLLLTLGSGLLERPLGIPAAVLGAAGLALLPFALVVAGVATRRRPPVPAVWAIIAANALWALDSLLVLVFGWLSPSPLGIAFVVTQAVAVALLAALPHAGLRRSAPAAA